MNCCRSSMAVCKGSCLMTDSVSYCLLLATSMIVEFIGTWPCSCLLINHTQVSGQTPNQWTKRGSQRIGEKERIHWGEKPVMVDKIRMKLVRGEEGNGENGILDGDGSKRGCYPWAEVMVAFYMNWEVWRENESSNGREGWLRIPYKIENVSKDGGERRSVREAIIDLLRSDSLFLYFFI